MTEQLFPFLRSFITLFFTQLYFSSDEDFLPDPNPIYIYKTPSLPIDFAVVQNGIFTVQKFNQYSPKKLDW